MKAMETQVAAEMAARLSTIKAHLLVRVLILRINFDSLPIAAPRAFSKPASLGAMFVAIRDGERRGRALGRGERAPAQHAGPRRGGHRSSAKPSMARYA